LIEVSHVEDVYALDVETEWFTLWDMEWNVRIAADPKNLNCYVRLDVAEYPQALVAKFEILNRSDASKSKRTTRKKTLQKGDKSVGSSLISLDEIKSPGFMEKKSILVQVSVSLDECAIVAELKTLRTEMKEWEEKWKELYIKENTLKPIVEAKVEWDKISARIKDLQPGVPIQLNVGGQLFTTSLTTLRRFEGSFFHNLVSGKVDVLKDGAPIFIDRDPFVFRHVLNFLRGEEMHFLRLNATERAALLDDTAFYQLPDLQAEIPRANKRGRPSIS